MTNHRAVLGLHDTAGADEIKKAFRKLAMLHHPDRGGNEEMFKTVKASYDALEASGFAPFSPPRQSSRPGPRSRPESPSGSWQNESIDDIYEQMFGKQSPPPSPAKKADGVMQVSIRDAANGFEWSIARQKQNGFVEHITVVIPGGLPDGHRGRYTLSDGSQHILVLNIIASPFKLRGLSNGVGTIFEAGITTGDIELDISLDAIDLICGAWVEVRDYLGEKLTVRVPAGFNPDQRLKVAGKGYFGWSADQQLPAKYRRDMYVKIQPIYNTPDKIDRDKIKRLYETVGGWEQNDFNNE